MSLKCQKSDESAPILQPDAISVYGCLKSAASLEPGTSGLKSDSLPNGLKRPHKLTNRIHDIDMESVLKAYLTVVGEVFQCSEGLHHSLKKIGWSNRLESTLVAKI